MLTIGPRLLFLPDLVKALACYIRFWLPVIYKNLQRRNMLEVGSDTDQGTSCAPANKSNAWLVPIFSDAALNAVQQPTIRRQYQMMIEMSHLRVLV